MKEYDDRKTSEIYILASKNVETLFFGRKQPGLFLGGQVLIDKDQTNLIG